MISPVTRRLFIVCAALASGEFLASRAPTFFELWPVLLVLALLMAVFGYAFAVRGWPYFVVAVLGATLFWGAAQEKEIGYREKPWMRNARARTFLDEPQSPWRTVKHDLSRRVSLGLGGNRELVQLNRAILLGERANLPRRLKETFVKSGTIHVFAISGLHVMAVAQVLMFLLRLVLVPRRWVGLCIIPLLAGYVILIGSPPSAVRAAAMAGFCCLAPVFERRPNILTAWALTFLAVYVISPTHITNVGCGLSFSVMLAILVVCDLLRDYPDGLRKTFLISLSAWAAGVPIAAHVFGRITPGGLLANLALIPAACGTVYAGILGLLASFVSETLAAHLNNFSALFTKAMVLISEFVSRIPGANFEIARWSLLMCAEWYLALALVVVLVRLRRSTHSLF